MGRLRGVSRRVRVIVGRGRLEAVGVAVAVLAILVIGAPSTQAALSPAPYLDTTYNTNFWNEVLSFTWPTGYPKQASDVGGLWDISAAAGTVPYPAILAAAVGGLQLPSAGSYTVGWKLSRTSDALWEHVVAAIGTAATSAYVSGEQWCNYNGSCYGVGTGYGSAYGLNNRDFILVTGINEGSSACPTSLAGGGTLQGWVPHFSDAGFDHSTPASYIACNDAVNNAEAGAGSLPGSDVTITASLCDSVASSIFNGHWKTANGGTCTLRIWHQASADAALITTLPVPYTSQSYSAVSTITTPSQSAGLSAARTATGSSSCSVQSEVNSSLDSTNWAPPDSASCGGAISVPAAATYGGGGGSSGGGGGSQSCNGHAGSQTTYYSLGPVTTVTTCLDGEPVNMATGNFFTGAIDVSLPATGVPLMFARSYNSLDTTTGTLGQGWTDNLNWTASVGGGGNVTIRTGTGQQFGFTDNGGQYTPDGEARATLSASGGGYTLVTKDQLSYVFNSSGQLTAITDRNGQGLALSYNGSGQLSSASGGGRTLAFSYSSGLLTGISVPGGRSVSYGYTGGLLTSFTDLRGYTVSYTYDSSGRLATIVDQNGHTVISNTYSSSTGRISGQTDARGHSTTFGWNATTGTATYTDANGHTWSQVYVNNTLRSETDPLGNTTTYTYDGALNLIAVKDPRGNTTTMTWDPNGNMLTRTAPAPLSYTQTWTYDSKNDVTSYTDGRGHTTTYGYNTNGDLTSVTLPNPSGSGAGPETTYGRNATTGLVTSITDPRSKETTFGYDSAGDLTSVTTPLGYETTYGYDSSGRMTSKVDPRGNVTGGTPSQYTWTYAYDDADHLTSQTDPLGNETQWSYDPAGNLSTFTDANSNEWTYAYDNANNLSTVTAPGSTVTTYSYDNNGNLTGKEDGNSHTTTYGYDNDNRLTSVAKPGGQTWTYTYDADSDLASRVDGNSGTTTYSYDALDRLTGISYSGTVTPNVTFTYDGAGNRTQMTDGGTVNYTYDNDNRLTAVTRGSQSYSYGYDANANLTSETYPDSTSISYAYTDDEQLASVASASNTTSYSYDPAGNLTTTTLPSGNGYTQTRTYDKAGRLTDVSNANSSSTLSAFAYTLDAVGNPTEVDQTGAATSTTTYGYDTRNWLTSVCLQASCPNSSDPKTSWTYDGVGNRLTQTTPSGTTTYSYNSDDEMTAAGATSYSYDANGNQTAAGSNTFTYDLANRLLSADVAGTTTTYSYDGDGNRLTSNDGTNTINYFWEPLRATPQLDIEQNGSGSDLRTYLYGAGPVSMTTGGSTFYYHSDALGSIANLTDSSGTPQWTYAYDPWGNTTPTQNTSGAPTNPLQYTGGYADPTGLVHLGARQYDPTSGRFTTTDPANEASGSTYAYADDQPTVAIDPSGLGNSYTFYSYSSGSSGSPSPSPVPSSSGSCPWYNPICTVTAVYDASKNYLQQHEWARCALFGASVVTAVGSYGLAVREAVIAVREGEGLGTISTVAAGTSSKLGTTGSLGVIAAQLTGGCLP